MDVLVHFRMACLHLRTNRVEIRGQAGEKEIVGDRKRTETFRLRLPSDTLIHVIVREFCDTELLEEHRRDFLCVPDCPQNRPKDRLLIDRMDST